VASDVAKTLAEIAFEAGLVGRADAAGAARLADKRGVPLVTVLVRELHVDELALVAAMRRLVRVPLVDPAAVRPDPDALREVPRDVCRRLKLLPVSVATDPIGTRVVRLAMADPLDAAALAEIEHLTAADIEVFALPLSAVEELIEQGYRGATTEVVQRSRRLFGEGLVAESGPALIDPTTEIPATVPHHNVADEADVELRHQALLQLLVAKGIVTEDEYQAAVRELLRGRTDEA